MAEYIEKSALVAEIIKRYDEYTSSILKHYDAYKEAKAQELGKILTILNTLEEKKVDLEKEIHLWMEDNTCGGYCSANIRETAEHFFELGLKAQKGGMIEALRTEYEKGRADVIADTLSWLANVWPQYCSNPNIIDAYKEGVVKD